jgi:hypothetical protein
MPRKINFGTIIESDILLKYLNQTPLLSSVSLLLFPPGVSLADSLLGHGYKFPDVRVKYIGILQFINDVLIGR